MLERHVAALGATRKITVFISYSRSDMAVADRLVAAIEKHNFDVRVDRRDLPFGEQWQKVLAQFIVQADAVIWLISDRSIKSEWCQWELGEVQRLGKRLLPVQIEQVRNSDLPQGLGRHHILPAEGLYNSAKHLSLVIDALKRDWAWIQEHTRTRRPG